MKPRIIELKELVKTEEALKWLECLYSNVPDSSYEASAYDAVLNITKNLEEKLIKEKEKTEKLRDALKFYANWKNYSSANHDYFEKYFATINNDHSFLEITENDGDNFTLPFGGKKAREALKEVGEK